ncbi:MAG: Ig domain-containing protein [Dehalococcoidia bacterium]
MLRFWKYRSALAVTSALALLIALPFSAAALTISTMSLPQGTVGVAYSQTITSSGGTSPYTYQVTIGALPPGLSLNASTGVISGTPTTAGTSAFTVQVTDATSTTSTQALAITVGTSGTLDVTSPTLPAGQVGVVYGQSLTATGGTLPYTWSAIAGGLPAGLTLNTSTGFISGTPTTAGASAFTVQVADSAAHTDTQALSIMVNAAGTLVGTTMPLANGQVGIAYSQTLTATGGTMPYTWSVIAGGLPAGLSLNTSTGVISGMPTTIGTMSFTVQVADSAAHTDTQALSITVNAAGTLAVTTASLTAGQVRVAYSRTLAATGGTMPYTWSVIAGGLPAGLSLNTSTGVISGTPTTAGPSAFTVQVADSAAHTTTQALSIMVNAAGTLTITTASLPAGQVGTAYSQTLAATGGTMPYTWSVIAGGLPVGLTLNTSTGVISGTPTTIGTMSFTVQVADSAAHGDTQALSITINAAGTGDGEVSLPGLHGLCNAIARGSYEGREHKRMAPPFQALLDRAAAAGMNRDDFCQKEFGSFAHGAARAHDSDRGVKLSDDDDERSKCLDANSSASQSNASQRAQSHSEKATDHEAKGVSIRGNKR